MTSRFPVLAARAAAAESRGQTFLVVLAGSSTTAGTGSSSRRRRSYAATLERAVRSRHPRARFENRGVGGTTAATYLPDVTCDAVAAQAPAALVHMVGGNDYARGVDPASYGEALRDRLDRIDAAAPLPCQHVLVHTFARPDVAEPAAPWSAFRAELDLAVAGHLNRAVIDVADDFAAVDRPEPGSGDAKTRVSANQNPGFDVALIRPSADGPSAGSAPAGWSRR